MSKPRRTLRVVWICAWAMIGVLLLACLVYSVVVDHEVEPSSPIHHDPRH